MKDYKAKELREKSVEELYGMLAEERAAQFKRRKEMVFRQSNDAAGLKTMRHNSARILTVIKEKEKANV